MGQDLGNVMAGFTHNFVYGSLSLSGGTYVRLVDNAHNATGAQPEALYVGTLLVPAGTTLDLNGLHVYAHQTQVLGTVVGGTINSGGRYSHAAQHRDAASRHRRRRRWLWTDGDGRG